MMGHWVRGVLVMVVMLVSPLPSVVFFVLARMLISNCVPLALDGSASPSTGWDIKGCSPIQFNAQPGTGPTVGSKETTKRALIAGFTVAQMLSLLLVPAAYALGVVDALIFPTLEIAENDAVDVPLTPQPGPGPSMRVPVARVPTEPSPSP